MEIDLLIFKDEYYQNPNLIDDQIQRQIVRDIKNRGEILYQRDSHNQG